MPDWVATLLGAALLAVGGCIGYTIRQAVRIARLEERVRNLGELMRSLPKRKSDGRND